MLFSMDSNGYYYSFWRGERLTKRPHFGPAGEENFEDAYRNFQKYMIENKGGGIWDRGPMRHGNN